MRCAPLATRLWRRVDGRVLVGGRDPGNSCWVWTGCRNKHGYGRIGVGGGRASLCHRVSFELMNGPIPPGMQVLHRCDNPPCVRPDHLFLGTHADNMRDMAAKGRGFGLSGRSNPNAKYSSKQIAELRQLVASGWPVERAAKSLFISFTQAYRLVRSSEVAA